MTQTGAILRVTDDLISVLKGKKVIKGATRSAIDLLVDILKGYDGEPTKIEDQQVKMEKKQPNRRRILRKKRPKRKTPTQKKTSRIQEMMI